TATTRAEALVGAVAWAARPLERFGVDPDRVGLILLITVGALPAVAALAHGAREAQAARCGARGVTAFAVPLAVAALRRADTLGEALTARGFDD
ncbi:MAG: energy-coupling factor transporter transmembrane protein EcfT, partial [Bifidobacteriaceae bacterium]|nr:energy-coupling factor transporter transmembrane protein EcfT [Bifidobacteriaceae bacterium]